MKEESINIYLYDYNSLQLTVEEEFFLSFLRATPVPVENKNAPLRYLIKESIYSENTFRKLMNRCERFLYWDKDRRCYDLTADGRHERGVAINNESKRRYLAVPRWAIKIVKDKKFSFTTLLLLADIYSFHKDGKPYRKSRSSLSRFLGVIPCRVTRIENELVRAGFIHVKDTETVNIVTLTDKFLKNDYTGRKRSTTEEAGKKDESVGEPPSVGEGHGTGIRRDRSRPGNGESPSSVQGDKKEIGGTRGEKYRTRETNQGAAIGYRVYSVAFG